MGPRSISMQCGSVRVFVQSCCMFGSLDYYFFSPTVQFTISVSGELSSL